MKHRQPFEIAILAAGVAALLAILAAPNLHLLRLKMSPSGSKCIPHIFP